MKKGVFAVVAVVLLWCANLYAAPIFAGYNKTPWGADVKTVTREYPKGSMSKLGTQDVYKQLNPTKEIKQRSLPLLITNSWRFR